MQLDQYRQVVHKFGGSSLVSPEAFVRVADLVIRDWTGDPSRRRFVVLSARGGLTDQLHDLLEKRRNNLDWEGSLSALAREQEYFIRSLFFNIPSQTPEGSFSLLATELDALHLDLIRLKQDLINFGKNSIESDSIEARTVGLGEIWSARLFHVLLLATGYPSTWINTRSILFSVPNGPSQNLDFDRSSKALESHLKGFEAPLVVFTGYISSLHDGRPTTLGRNGSDYSAALVAALSHAEQLTIWSDVDGILTIDPDLCEPAITLDYLSYSEADELARLGAGVLHSHTIQPLFRHGIPVLLKNSLNHEHPGSRIGAETKAGKGVITGISNVQMVCLSYGGSWEKDSRFFEKKCQILAFAQEGDRVFLAFEKDQEAAVSELLKLVSRNGKLRLQSRIQGSLVAWVKDRESLSVGQKDLWRKQVQRINSRLVFQKEGAQSSIAFLRWKDHQIPTRLLHRKMMQIDSGKELSNLESLAQVS